ncbi:hypothetical protein LINPERPRIM_LOCUS35701 [Linum perenne]
MPAVVGRRTAT